MSPSGKGTHSSWVLKIPVSAKGKEEDPHRCVVEMYLTGRLRITWYRVGGMGRGGDVSNFMILTDSRTEEVNREQQRGIQY